ncbi:MAG: transposase [Candidatus Azambacteria bacterium]|nr:transposase [Candidatus Azambacteria bacterium]
MKNPTFTNDHIYHIYNRGVEKRDVFMDEKDYFRFVHDLYEFNDEAPAANIFYKLPNFQSYEVGLRKIGRKEKKPRKCLVNILVFCLMTNHFHMLLQQKQDNGIATFMQKLGTGYTNYFNKKYERVGPLFQGKFKAALVEQESHFIHLPYYIHANPLAIIKTKEHGKRDLSQNAAQFLESYRWSSYPDYIEKKNFPSVTQREFLLQFFNGTVQYKKDMMAWVQESDAQDLQDVILD